MKGFILLIAMSAYALSSAAQTENPKYDKVLAESLGADDYGMKMYVMAILRTGPAEVTDQQRLGELFRGHMQNINRLAKEGKLVIAGPFQKNDKQYRGIFIFNVRTIAEAQELLKTDPAVKEKVFDTELFEWYGSAALSEYLKSHELIEKKKP